MFRKGKAREEEAPQKGPGIITSILESRVGKEPPSRSPLATYSIGDSSVSIHTIPDRVDMCYFVKLPELGLSRPEARLLDQAFEELCSYRPDTGYSSREIRTEFRRAALGILKRVAEGRKVDAGKLGSILLRHTIGYGIIEPILEDENVQDVYVDSGSSMVHIVHSEYGECVTNISLTPGEIEKLSTRMRASSGRPFDTSSPVLHAELEEFGVRVCGIREPSTYKGTGFAFRRRKREPWTLSEFISVNMLDSRTAGLLSFLVDSQNSFLVTGPRSSGKTSILTALLLEIPQNVRIILIEDTPEVPVQMLRDLGFKVEHMKTEAFAKGFELSAEEALRTSLRLGDSVLVIGEVRGPEARALFEAMRIGAAGNVVLGTIHGSGVRDTWDRVVNDLGVPSTSFKAVDLVVSAGTIRAGEGIKRHRRLLQVSEVKDSWVREPRFSDLVRYMRRGDRWDSSFSGSQKIRKAAETKGLTGRQVLDAINIRARMKHDLHMMAHKHRNPLIMGPEWTVAANNQFLKLAGRNSNYKEVYRKWSEWLRKACLKGGL